MAQGFAALERTLSGLSDDLTGTAAKARLERIAKAMPKDIEDAVRGDLGDLSMSGWRRKSGATMDVVGMAEVVSDTAILARPAPMSRGPMRVLEQGRNVNASAGEGKFADAPTRLTKSGRVSKAKVRRAKRWNGYTSGKATWTDAEYLLVDRVPVHVHDELVAVLNKKFGGGG